MPITVLCTNCKARFAVSDKFAGKKGPCPKCKTILQVPDTPDEEIKVHVPEQFASGGKDSKGRSVSKPILREETKLAPTAIVAIAGAVLMTLVVAFLMRGVTNKLPVIIAGLIVLAPPLAVAGYSFLRDDEMEPYRGKALLLRATLCGLAYAALWGAFWPLTAYGIITGEPWQWLFVAPVFIAAGAGISFALLDLDFGSAAMHYCFFIVVSLLLRFAIGLPPLWASVEETMM